MTCQNRKSTLPSANGQSKCNSGPNQPFLPHTYKAKPHFASDISPIQTFAAKRTCRNALPPMCSVPRYSAEHLPYDFMTDPIRIRVRKPNDGGSPINLSRSSHSPRLLPGRCSGSLDSTKHGFEEQSDTSLDTITVNHSQKAVFAAPKILLVLGTSPRFYNTPEQTRITLQKETGPQTGRFVPDHQHAFVPPFKFEDILSVSCRISDPVTYASQVAPVWTPGERDEFWILLSKHGKNFSAIAREMSNTKSTKEVVNFYYRERPRLSLSKRQKQFATSSDDDFDELIIRRLASQLRKMDRSKVSKTRRR